MTRTFEVLIVDDSPTQLTLMKGMLESEGDISVRSAADGRLALDEITKGEPDLVLTDLQMPEMNGLELVEAIKASFPSLAVILTTSHGSEDIAATALQLGAASYVPKTEMNSVLIPTVRQVLQMSDSTNGTNQISACLESSSVTLLLCNDETLVPDVISRLELPMVELGLFDEGERMQISMALDEALLNAMIHGNLSVSSELREIDEGRPYREMIDTRVNEAPYKERTVHVSMHATKDGVEFVIRDQGDGFDVSSLPDPTDPANLENASGRGLLLINAFMDEVKHNSTGNEITMIKRISPSDD